MSFNVPTDLASRPVAVIGAGTLGRRIALIFAAHGAEVRIYDLAEVQRHAAVDYVKQNLPTLADELTGVVRGRVSAKAGLAEAVHTAWAGHRGDPRAARAEEAGVRATRRAGERRFHPGQQFVVVRQPDVLGQG